MWGSYTASNPNLTIERYDRLRWRRNIIVILLALGLFTILTFVGLAVGYRNQRPWLNYDTNPNYYCEAARPMGFTAMPSNAWFTLPLLGAAGFVAYGGLHDLLLIESRANVLVASPVLSLVQAIFLYATFVISFLAYSCACKSWFYASVGLFNASLAWGAVYSILSLVNSRAGWNLRPALVSVAQVILLGVFAGLAIVTDDALEVFVMMVLGAAMIAVYIYEFENVNKTLYYVTFSLILLSLVVWLLDVIDVACSEYSAFQWHSIWSVIAAFVFISSYAFLRSENYRTSLQPYTVL